jgi:PBP1b-binding outer membrane lipoprotein LpoB
MRNLVIVMITLVFILSGCKSQTNEIASPAPTQSGAVSTPTMAPTQNGNNTQVNPVNSSSPAPSAPPKAPAGAKEPLVITKEKYDKLVMNSTYEEVEKSIGLGKLIKQTEHQATYQYKDEKSGTIELEFWDGKLNSKSISDIQYNK